MYRQRLGWMVVVCFVLLLSTLIAQVPTSQAQTIPTPTPTPAMCNGLPATILVVASQRSIFGTPADDVIVMIGTANHVIGRDGADTICMIGDDNIAFGGDDNDFISFTGIANRGVGGPGEDTCVATPMFTNRLNCEHR